MPIKSGVCVSYGRELFRGIHKADDVYRIALYTSDAKLSSRTASYTKSGEVVGNGYTAGGEKLQGFTDGSKNGTSWITFGDVRWNLATITARGALIYNETRERRAVMVLDFGSDKSSSDGDFLVMMPVADEATALLRLLES